MNSLFVIFMGLFLLMGVMITNWIYEEIQYQSKKKKLKK